MLLLLLMALVANTNAVVNEWSHQDTNHWKRDLIEKESLSTFKNMQEELRGSLSYCQTMLSSC